MNFNPQAHFFEQGHGYITSWSTCKRCNLCQLDVQQGEWQRHRQEETHQLNLCALIKVASDECVLYHRQIEALSWEPRISRLGPTLPEDFHRAMLDYLTDEGIDSTAVTVPLERCEAVERVVLGELVVWKALCTISVPQDTTFRTVLDCHAWTCSGWKVLKEDVRESNTFKSVASRVSSYLERCEHKGKGRATQSDSPMVKTIEKCADDTTNIGRQPCQCQIM
jgi:hypothetical protein